MKKIIVTYVILLSILLVLPRLAAGAGLVPCGDIAAGESMCGISDLFTLIVNAYSFAIFFIATPLATLFIVIGGILLLVSGGNPGLAGTGRKMLTYSVIGLVLVLGSWLIINVLLNVIGYTGAGFWWHF